MTKKKTAKKSSSKPAKTDWKREYSRLELAHKVLKQDLVETQDALEELIDASNESIDCPDCRSCHGTEEAEHAGGNDQVWDGYQAQIQGPNSYEHPDVTPLEDLPQKPWYRRWF